MKLKAAQLIPAFATPFSFSQVIQAEQWLTELKQTLLAKVMTAYANPNQNSTKSDKLFESNFDLLIWPEESISVLKKILLEALVELVGSLGQYKRSQVAQFKIFADAWFHVTYKQGAFTNHNHPMASWSCVFCVDDGDDEGLNESGVTRFFHPNPAASMYLDAGNINMTDAPFGYGHQYFKLKTGDLLFFPSWLYHDVSPYLGDSKRITVAANFWFKDKDRNPQQGPMINKVDSP